MSDQTSLVAHTLLKSELPKAFFISVCDDDYYQINSTYYLYLHKDICTKAEEFTNQSQSVDVNIKILGSKLSTQWGSSSIDYEDYRYAYVASICNEKVDAIKTILEMVYPGAFKPQLRESLCEILLPV